MVGNKMIKAKKHLGQNFLQNENTLKKIADSIKTSTNDLIIEIGPGTGALTKYLAGKDSYLLCYEIDTSLKPYLEKYKNDKTNIIYTDFLKRDILEDIKNIPYENLYLIANIPYYITTPIILKLMNYSFQKIILLVQKEFAERITAQEKTKNYNAFTLFVDLEYKTNLLFTVSKNDFYPVPKVDSAVISLEKKNEVYKNKEFYLEFIKNAFQNKRKTLKNNLKSYDYNKINEILKNLGYKDNVRAEEISKEDFLILYQKYIEKL